MKNSLICMLGVLFVFASCKEKPPPINFGGSRTSADTTYVLATVPSADPHQVLIEEFTGQSCPNCPAAHENLTGFEQQYPGRLNIMGMYIYNFSQATPPDGALYDLRDSSATQIGNSIYNGIGVEPSAGIDRIADAGNSGILLLQPWGSIIADRLNVVDSVNLAVSSTFNAGTGVATITYKATYTQAVSEPQSINIVVVEDSVIDLQEFPTSVQSGYIFTNIFRSILTAVPYGDPIKPDISPKEAGRVVQQAYTYTLRSGLVAQHCRVIAFVTNGTSNAVVQSAQCKLTGL